MRIDKKIKIVNIVTFLVHLIIAVAFILLGYVVITWESAWARGYQSANNFTIDYFIILAGMILLGLDAYMLVKKSWQAYISLILATLVGMQVWITVEGSIDMEWLLRAYLVFFTPVSWYRYRMTKFIENKGQQ